MGGIYYIPPSPAPAVNSLAIGDPITLGTANRVLYENAANQLAESANLAFDGTILEGKTFRFYYDKAGDPLSYVEYVAGNNLKVFTIGTNVFSVFNSASLISINAASNFITNIYLGGSDIFMVNSGTNFITQTRDAGVLTTHLTLHPGGKYDVDNLALPTTGAAIRCGNATLIAGTITVNTTAASATCEIFLQLVTIGGTPGLVSITKVAGVSFTLTSLNALDTSTYSFLIIETF